jgi:hypothetical protein
MILAWLGIATMALAGQAPATPPTIPLISQTLPAPPPPATTGSLAPTAIRQPVPFTIFRGKILFVMTVQGRSATAILDSGADFSVVDTGFAAAAGLSPSAGGQIDATIGELSVGKIPAIALELPGQFTAQIPVLSADLSKASQLYGRKIDFILGGDILRKLAVAIDFGAQRFRFGRTGLQPAGLQAIPVELARYAPIVPVQVGTQQLKLLLDLGSGGSLSVSPDAWTRIKPQGVRVTDAAVAAANGEIGIFPRARIAHVTIAGVDEPDVEVNVLPVPVHVTGKADGLIGLAILSRYDVVLDIPAGKLWLRLRRGAPPPPVDRTGLALVPDGDALKVLHVSTGSPAAASGWKSGDRICRVGGVAARPDGGIRPAWAVGKEGSTIAIELCNGQTRQLTLANYY